MKAFAEPHVLVCNEIGYLGCGDNAADVSFQIVDQCYLKGRLILFTTNKPLRQWGRVLHDKKFAIQIFRLENIPRLEKLHISQGGESSCLEFKRVEIIMGFESGKVSFALEEAVEDSSQMLQSLLQYIVVHRLVPRSRLLEQLQRQGLHLIGASAGIERFIFAATTQTGLIFLSRESV